MYLIKKGFVWFLMCYAVSVFALNEQSRVAFYYGSNELSSDWKAFNVVVVQGDNPTDPKKYDNKSSELYAYVSIGEVQKKEKYASKVSNLVIGENKNWQSHVMDLSNPKWQNFILSNLVKPLWEKGYRGFFFDTLDSYELTKKNREQQEQGLITIIKKIKSTYPSAKIILNRGFSVIDKVADDIDAVAVESLYKSYDPKTAKYIDVGEKERTYLLPYLNNIRTVLKRPVIVIDYLPSSDKKMALETASRIRSLGFIPWVADAMLEHMGVGDIEIIPRKILVFVTNLKKDIELSEHNYFPVTFQLSFPLQFMGYIPIYRTFGSDIPKDMEDQYAGVVFWFDRAQLKDQKKLTNVVQRLQKAHIPFVFFNYLGIPFNSPLYASLGLKGGKTPKNLKTVSIKSQDKMVGYEIMPKPDLLDFHPLKTHSGKVLLSTTASSGETEDAVAITDFGGYALAPFSLISVPYAQSRWVVNPFEFFKKALRLQDIPVPDLTTSNGRRMLMFHIDGDAYISRVPWLNDMYAGELILAEILKKYKIPVTVSIIEREFSLIKNNPVLHDRLMQVARNIFSLPWVTIATHTYSHPLEWESLVEGQENTQFLSYPEKGYHFSYEREITGSMDFINHYLAPANKKVKMVLWSGNTQVSEKPLAIAEKDHLLNFNGEGGLYLSSQKSVTNLVPFSQSLGSYIHVLSPIPNDFSYTHYMKEPLYWYIQVIDTFKLTDAPIRYKPISVYYHFYSAVDQGAFRALKTIYEWTMTQKTTPLAVIDYAKKVVSFNRLVIAKALNGGWVIANNGNLREFRIPVNSGKPEVSVATNVIGFNKINDQYYIHLGELPVSLILLNQQEAKVPYLSEANADRISWKAINSTEYSLSFDGYVPFVFKLENTSGCQVFDKNTLLIADTEFYYHTKDTHGIVSIRCR